MGIDLNGIKLLLYAKSTGVSFAQMATIGRQGLHISKNDLRELCDNSLLNDSDVEEIYTTNGFADSLFESMGAKSVCSFDYSEYEGASVVHDFNIPIPMDYHEKFSLVLDGGTLEHIFNFPVALKNCMQMVSVGGHLISITTANNFLGHGFYQFSPELFYRALSEENGFNIIDMFIYEDSKSGSWYKVVDPKNIGQRGTLANRCPTLIATIAKKISTVQPFKEFPGQSDYNALWKKYQNGPDVEQACSWFDSIDKRDSKSPNENHMNPPSYLRKMLRKALTLTNRLLSCLGFQLRRIHPQTPIKSPYKSIFFKEVDPNHLS